MLSKFSQEMLLATVLCRLLFQFLQPNRLLYRLLRQPLL